MSEAKITKTDLETKLEGLGNMLHMAECSMDLLKIGEYILEEAKRLAAENKRLYAQVTEQQRFANQQLNLIRKLTWTEEQWAEYEHDFGPQDCGPSEPYHRKR